MRRLLITLMTLQSIAIKEFLEAGEKPNWRLDGLEHRSLRIVEKWGKTRCGRTHLVMSSCNTHTDNFCQVGFSLCTTHRRITSYAPARFQVFNTREDCILSMRGGCHAQEVVE